MKNRKLLNAGFAVAIVALAGYNTCLKGRKYDASTLVMENIEALADDGEGSMKTKVCYKVDNNSSNRDYRLFCNEKTDDNVIYDCLSTSYNTYSEMSKDKCIDR